jgi:DNA (cytosine-5)-methyltransferase 1
VLTMRDVWRANGVAELAAASLFAGGGGSSIGYRLAGFDVVYACEHDPQAAAVYAANSAIAPDERDVRELTGDDVGDVDVLDGSPPCQDFSTVGGRDMDGDRAGLYYEFVRLVGEARPRAFCAENVVGFAVGESYDRHFAPIMRALRAHGYRVGARTLDGSWLGLPQARRRVVLVGVREDLGIDPPFPRRHARQTTIRDALPHVARLVRRPGAGYRARHYRWAEERTWPASGPAPTILASGMAAYSAKDVLVETLDGDRRPPTVRELKLLCGFPVDFEFPDETEPWRVLGNAVPPPMARAWASELATALGDPERPAEAGEELGTSMRVDDEREQQRHREARERLKAEEQRPGTFAHRWRQDELAQRAAREKEQARR